MAITITINPEDGNDPISIKKAAMDAAQQLRDQVSPSPKDTMKRALKELGSGKLAAGIAGDNAAYAKSVQRTLERWADGTRRPSAKGLAKYQELYKQHNNGESSPILQKLMDIQEGKFPKEFPTGQVSIGINGTFEVDTGTKKKPSIDKRVRTVNMRIKPARRDRALADPYESWLAQAEVEMPEYRLSDINHITITFTPRNEEERED